MFVKNRKRGRSWKKHCQHSWLQPSGNPLTKATNNRNKLQDPQAEARNDCCRTSPASVHNQQRDRIEEGLRLALDLIDEVRDEANAKIVQHQKRASFYYTLRVKERFFR
ncbi:hypothetical protein POM88_029140 [Heracleum sosnowskyi]|uniref:Uncharacterized protein n=1 Tax=Heracleum sosnowskyi TaxID=360622 RepID=A0AAD8MHH0_9APIA|nr:hypothetical protein POM88_029140 [Heracleum sosnowskyi]